MNEDSLAVSLAGALLFGAMTMGCTGADRTPAAVAREAGTGAGGAVAVESGTREAGKPLSGLTLTWRVVGLAPLGPYVGGDHGDAHPDAAPPANYFTGPLEGMKVCRFDDEPGSCTTTDAEGRFSIAGLPAKSHAILSFEKAGYFSLLLPVETGSTDMDGSVAGPLPIVSNTGPASGVPVVVDASGKGMIVAFAVALPSGTSVGGAVGTSLALTPKGGDGPYFITERNVVDVSATSIVQQTALYLNLEPGTYELGFTKPGHDCAPLTVPFGFGFSSGPSSVGLPVVAGYQTLCGALCAPSSVIVDTGD